MGSGIMSVLGVGGGWLVSGSRVGLALVIGELLFASTLSTHEQMSLEQGAVGEGGKPQLLYKVTCVVCKGITLNRTI